MKVNFDIRDNHAIVISSFLKFSPFVSFDSGNKHNGGTCSLEVASLSHT